jgi:hypothetical protein
MCRIEIIHQEADTLISMCQDCGHIKLYFGMLIMEHNRKSFAAMRQMVAELINNFSGENNENQKVIFIGTQAKGLTMAFTMPEACALYDALCQVLIILESRDLISGQNS